MNTTTTAVMTGVLVAAGRWSQGKTIGVEIAIGTAGVALILSLIANANEQLAQRFGLLILLAAAFAFLPGLVSKLGLNDTKKS